MAILLGILSFIGALPGLIDAFKRLYEYIQGIRNRKIRKQMKAEHKALVHKAMRTAFKNRSRKLSTVQNSDVMNEVNDLDHRVQVILLNQQF